MGKFLMFLGFFAEGAIWLYATFVFFSTGQALLGIVSLVIPPAALVLPFLISVPLGLISLACTGVMFLGAMLARD